MAYFRTRQPGYYGPGMGLVGPDQPWTSENAGKVLVPATDGKKCDPVLHKRATRFSEFAIPKTTRGGEVVEDTACFKTGRIWEARKAGLPRHVEWCCPKEQQLPPRKLTQAEYEEWKERCTPTRRSDGTIVEMIPGWRGAESYVGSSCTRTGVYEGAHELVCCPPPLDPKLLTATGMTHAVRVPITEEQQAEWDAQTQELLFEQEQERQAAALPPASFFSRYGLPLALVVGTVGIAVTAALLKRRSVAKKKVEAVQAAVEALQERG